MDCKAALTEADGDTDRAIELLRVKGQASAAKREGRGTNEGVVSSYIHANDRVGAMVEVQCETGFRRPATRTSRSLPTRWPCTSPRRRRATSRPTRSTSQSARPKKRGLRSEGARRRQARQRGRENRRRAAQEVGQRSRPARPGPRQRRETRLEDDRGAAPGAGGGKRARTSASPASPISASARNRLAPVTDDSAEPKFGRILLKLSGEALMGRLEYGTDGAEVDRIAHQVSAQRERGVEIAIVVGAGNIYRGPRRRRQRHGPSHRRLHGDAGDGA